MITQYTKKAIKCGDFIEVYEYATPIFRGLQSKLCGARGGIRTPKPRTCQSLMRTRKNIRQLVNANPTMDKFLTLTFAENVTDIKGANYEFKKFRRKLEYYLGQKFKYLGVIEFQKRGAIHYHLVLDIPFIKWQKLTELWGNGRIKIEKLRNRSGAGAYLAKITAELVKGAEDTRLYGKKVYFYSVKLLDRAIIIVNTIGSGFDALVECCKKVLFERAFYIQGHGIIEYALYGTD